MLDSLGRPYFLWDLDMTLERFEELLRTGQKTVREYYVAKLMRQAKPEDVFLFVTLGDIRGLWPRIQHRLGRTREFWTRWMEQWGVSTHP